MADIRSLDEVRELILGMPFASAMRLKIESGGEGSGVVSMPLHDAVSFDRRAFAGVAVSTVADVAAGVAALRTIDRTEMPLTIGVDVSITASTRGERLRAQAELLKRDGRVMVFEAVVHVHRDEVWTPCGAATVRLRTG